MLTAPGIRLATHPGVAPERARAYLDVAVLAAAIEHVDDSAWCQGVALCPANRAELVARLYAEVIEKNEPLDDMTTDRLVWMHGG